MADASLLIPFVAANFLGAFVAGVAGFAFGLVAAAIWPHVLTPLQTATLIVVYGLIVQGYAVWKLRRALDRRRLLRRPVLRASDRLVTGDIAMDLGARTATRSTQPVTLTPREYAVLEFLLRHPGQALSRTQIAEGVWSWEFHGESNVVDVYIGYLRRKLDTDGVPSIIETLRGYGYRLRSEVHRAQPPAQRPHRAHRLVSGGVGPRHRGLLGGPLLGPGADPVGRGRPLARRRLGTDTGAARQARRSDQVRRR